MSGRVVRYVAPENIKERDTYEITYVAQNLEGKKANGLLRVTVVPADDPNDPPEPPTLESRVTSADSVKIRVPGTGVDRNGDPVTVTGITSAPRLGRIVSYGGNFLEYEAYPRTVGTDEFTYSVVDSQGAFATGTVRVGVVQGHAVPAAAGGRGPADRGPGTYRDVRPARERLRRARRLRRGHPARRSRRRRSSTPTPTSSRCRPRRPRAPRRS